jgi:hypothetical protein
MLIFPPSIQENEKNRPVIMFKNLNNLAGPDKHIVLPIPQNIQYSDSAAYNPTELNFVGGTVLKAARSGSTKEALKSTINTLNSAIPKSFADTLGLIANSSGKISKDVTSAVGIATGTTMNKNVTSEFSGVATRQFSFQFKLISDSLYEAQTIENIVRTFRRGLYPTGDLLQLKYPPTWYISFMQGGKDIYYLPKIFETYLTTFSTSYNSSMNLFHPDGAPVEVDIQLAFMETRALTLSDILILEGDSFLGAGADAFANPIETTEAMVDSFFGEEPS